MQTYRFIPASFLAVAAIAGCSTMSDNTRLNEARNDYSAAQSNPQVNSLAPSELKQAGDALAKANEAASKKAEPEMVTHLAYVAKQKVAIAQETAKQKESEAAVANAGLERNSIRLEARTAEAEKAQKNAEAAQRAAEAAQQNASSSQRQAEASQRQADASQLSAEESKRQAEAEKQKTEASALAAEASLQAANLAKQQADISQQQARDAEQRATEMESQLKDLKAKKTDRGMVITLGDVLFDTNKAELKKGSTGDLQKLGDFLKKYPDRQVQIEGFTDSTGTVSYNQELSDRRANAVRTALVAMGITTDRITTRGFGPESPVASNATPAGRQMNRRVEIIFADEPASDVSKR